MSTPAVPYPPHTPPAAPEGMKWEYVGMGMNPTGPCTYYFVFPEGKASKVGKLTFIHGDTIKGGQNPAIAAVTNYERNIRFGHFHICYGNYT